MAEQFFVKTVNNVPANSDGNVVVSATDGGTDEQNYKTISANTTLDGSYHKAIVVIDANADITFPLGLRADFTFDAFSDENVGGLLIPAQGVTFNSNGDGNQFASKSVFKAFTRSLNNIMLRGDLTTFIPPVILENYFVRPAGTIYGTGDGTSYANAFSGFSNINWSVLENKNLNVIDTHFQMLNVQQNNVFIIGNNVNGAGIINGQNARTCLEINNFNYVTISNLAMINGLVANAFNRETNNTIYNDCLFDTSTNQTVQHEGANLATLIEVTYNGCTFKNGVDDGVSLHGNNTILTLNGCTFESNGQGVNAINEGVCVINDGIFISNTVDVQPDSNADFTVNRCSFTKTLAPNSSVALKINNCIFKDEAIISLSSNGSIDLKDSKFINNSTIISRTLDLNKCKITRCYFERGDTGSAKLSTQNNGVFNVSYCTFRHTGTGTSFLISTGSGTGTSFIENCNFIGNINANAGRGIVAGARLTARNTIFTRLNLVTNPNGADGIVTFESCCTFSNNTINVNQNGGTFSNVNNVTTNPLFTDIANLDFRLQSGSSCWNNGLTLTNPTGIETANFVTIFPTVITKQQTATWDRGAYIH